MVSKPLILIEDKPINDILYKKLEANIRDKYLEVSEKYSNHPSLQHSMFILREEMLELFEQVHKKDWSWNYSSIYKEAIDVIVACYRLLLQDARFKPVIENDWEI